MIQGLPFEWEKILLESGFQKADIISNVNNMVDMLYVYENGIEFLELPTSKEVNTYKNLFNKYRLKKSLRI